MAESRRVQVVLLDDRKLSFNVQVHKSRSTHFSFLQTYCSMSPTLNVTIVNLELIVKVIYSIMCGYLLVLKFIEYSFGLVVNTQV